MLTVSDLWQYFDLALQFLSECLNGAWRKHQIQLWKKEVQAETRQAQDNQQKTLYMLFWVYTEGIEQGVLLWFSCCKDKERIYYSNLEPV